MRPLRGWRDLGASLEVHGELSGRGRGSELGLSVVAQGSCSLLYVSHNSTKLGVGIFFLKAKSKKKKKHTKKTQNTRGENVKGSVLHFSGFFQGLRWVPGWRWLSGCSWTPHGSGVLSSAACWNHGKTLSETLMPRLHSPRL